MFFTKPYADALIVLLIVLLFFGPKRLPALGRSLGDGLREFKDSIGGKSDDEQRPELDAANPSAAPEPQRAAVASEPESPKASTESRS
jgi:sec-independent protein translocase protein TatA